MCSGRTQGRPQTDRAPQQPYNPNHLIQPEDPEKGVEAPEVVTSQGKDEARALENLSCNTVYATWLLKCHMGSKAGAVPAQTGFSRLRLRRERARVRMIVVSRGPENLSASVEVGSLASCPWGGSRGSH